VRGQRLDARRRGRAAPRRRVERLPVASGSTWAGSTAPPWTSSGTLRGRSHVGRSAPLDRRSGGALESAAANSR
jgi:hypothetical protein